MCVGKNFEVRKRTQYQTASIKKETEKVHLYAHLVDALEPQMYSFCAKLAVC